MLSVVVPLFNEEASFPHLQQALDQLADQLLPRGIKTQVVLVDNRSDDSTWSLVEEWVSLNGKIRVLGVRHPHNLGMQQSLLTGLKLADGSCVAVLQADLQDPPDLLVEMVNSWLQGSLYVATQMSKRHEKFIHRFGAWCFYQGLRFVSGQKVRSNSTDFYLLDRSLVSEVIFRSGTTPFLRSTIASIKAPGSVIQYERADRRDGRKMSVRRKADFAFEAFLVNLGGLARKLAAVALILCAVVSLAAIGLLAAFIFGYRSPVAGWMTSTLLLAALLAAGLLLSSLQLTFLYRMNRELPRRDWISASDTIRSTNHS